MKTLEKWISRVSIVLVSMVLLAMMLQVVLDVFMRSVLGAGFPATTELVGRYYMVAISVLPLAMTEVHRRHIEATIFTDGVRGTPRRIMLFFGFTVGLIVFVLLAYGSTGEALRQTARRAYVEVGTVQFPTWLSFWIPPVAFWLMTMVLGIRIVEVLTGRFAENNHDPLAEIDSHLLETK
ncbi:TRAP transporter small permease [Tropicimonas sp. IMCC34043]|uniref:TRAP transporter small permease n=1 Tax=Tropicimonas sp. IMCC34043 TaxID=2248760 RepID=UPI000E2554A8|nr:TRAP transporter small permease subunit [Tropicimonas sp. IMCC34043]